MPLRTELRYNKAVSLSRGPLLFSLGIGTHWRNVGGDEPRADWEVYPTESWNYALELDPDSPLETVEVLFGPLGGRPFPVDETPIRLRARGRLLPEWTPERNAAAAPPPSPVETLSPRLHWTWCPTGQPSSGSPSSPGFSPRTPARMGLESHRETAPGLRRQPEARCAVGTLRSRRRTATSPSGPGPPGPSPVSRRDLQPDRRPCSVALVREA